MSMFSTALSWLADQLNEHASETVIYRRGNVSASLKAVRGTSSAIESNQLNQQVRVFFRDFIILPADLVLDGYETKPVAGDQIELANGEVYEVLTDGTDPGWRWSDPQHKAIRIHTQLQTNGY
jgi:hypothetical protein